MRLLILVVPLLVMFAACGQSPSPAAKQSSVGEPGQVTLGRTQHMPDWLLVARLPPPGRGFVHFNQRSIVRHTDGTADIWVQIRYGSPQLEGEQGEQTIRYQLERRHYRFDCAGRRFTMLKRQFLDDEDTVAAGQDMPVIWRPVPPSGIALIVMPIACRGR